MALRSHHSRGKHQNGVTQCRYCRRVRRVHHGRAAGWARTATGSALQLISRQRPQPVLAGPRPRFITSWQGVTAHVRLLATAQGVVGFPADLFPADLTPADALQGVDLVVAIRATRPDHPTRSRAANESHTGTSRGRAIRRCTNNNAGLPS